jgi:polysaccharide pyruvyl transferase WcaK-like protein
MKKIGILTYTREYSNLGTNMQAYCTLKAIQKAFPADRVELIDYSSWFHGMKPYLSNASWGSLKKDLVRFRKYREFFNTQLAFSRDRLRSADLQKSLGFIGRQGYDAIYVGSDTVLELKRARAGELTAYWLDPAIRCPKCLIAASALNVEYETLSGERASKIRRTLEDFSLLGVRDDATFRLLEHFLPENDCRLRMIPDPTFAHDIDYAHVERYLESHRLSFQKPVICLHLTRDAAWAQDLADQLRKAGFAIASFRPAHYADVILTDLSPFEQVGIYKSFALVITHRFHDTIFSLKNHTPVIVYPENISDVTSRGENKNVSLLRLFGLEELHYVGNRQNLSAHYLAGIHREAIENMSARSVQIEETLRSLQKGYESFVEESRDLIFS